MHFNEFIRAQIKEFGSDRFVHECVQKCPDNIRHGQGSNGSRSHGKFQVSDVNLEYQAHSSIQHSMDHDPNYTFGKNWADLMKNYFSTIDEKTYSLFIDDAPPVSLHENNHT